jgi:DNA helicase-2/ATP-dependent DNA helicase PcrA
MDVEDQKTVLREVYEELDINSKDVTFKQAIKHISIQKMDSSYIDYLAESKDIKIKKILSKYPENEETEIKSDEDILLKDSPRINDKIFFKYLEKQRRNFALDFDDLINFALYIFEHFNDVLEKWQKRLYYIQVDETQDSSYKQFHLVDLLSQVHKNLFVVGDPDQTIYEWRGAMPEILVDFDKRYTGCQTLIMNQNYRSTPNILNLGNYIIKNFYF